MTADSDPPPQQSADGKSPHDRRAGAADGGGRTADEVHVRLARPEEVIDLRHRVLRQGLPRGEAMFPGDDEPTTRHFVATRGGEDVVGCVTLVLNEWEGAPAWQLRGMAVAPELQRSGVGRGLLEQVDQFVAASAVPRLWCNARAPATAFYRRHGWTVVSDVFKIPRAGPHVRMIKVVTRDY